MNYSGLPPLKRFTLMQQQQQQQRRIQMQNQNQSRRLHEQDQENMDPSFASSTTSSSLPLPAKKRKESRHLSPPSSTYYCLPTKKRVLAFEPTHKPLFPLDLNAEYNPRFHRELEADRESKKPFDEGNAKEEPTNDRPSETVVANEEAEEGKELEEERQENDNESQNQSQNVEEEEDDDDGIVCAVCKSTDGDPTDPIVFCDGCDLMAHATCYGDPLAKGVPEGDWFCNRCLASSNSADKKKAESFSCSLCPNKEGALKSTVEDGKWAHIVCALFVPEVFFEDPEGRNGINCSKVPKKRWETRCYICGSEDGCSIDCSEPKCPLAFHVTCGLSEDLCIEYREGKRNGAIVAGFCKNHSELWKKQQQTGKFKIVAREEQW